MIKSVITISRQYGSGGREIGEKLAKDLGIPFYDSKLLEIASKDSGINQDFFEENDEKPINSLLYVLANTYTGDNLPFNHRLFLAQFEAVKKVASEGPCVIVGRCADYALSDFKDCINIFIHASIESRIERAVSKYDVPESKAENIIIRTDKQRASYYSFYTNQKWAKVENYDLSLDSSVLGTDKSVELIKQFIKLKEE